MSESMLLKDILDAIDFAGIEKFRRKLEVSDGVCPIGACGDISLGKFSIISFFTREEFFLFIFSPFNFLSTRDVVELFLFENEKFSFIKSSF